MDTITRFEASVESGNGRKFSQIFVTRVEAEDFAVEMHQRYSAGSPSLVTITRLVFVDNSQEITRLDFEARHCPAGMLAMCLQAIRFLSDERAEEDEVVETYTLE